MFCFYAPEEAQFEFGNGGDTSPELNRESYLYPVNVAIQEGRQKAGLVVDLDRQLPPLLAEAGLRVVAEDKGTIPVGKMVGEMLGGGAGAGVDGVRKEGVEGENLDVPRHVPYSVKSFGPPSPSAVKTGFDFGEKDTTTTSTTYTKLADDERATTLATHPHIQPPLPLSPPLSATDLRTIEGATSKMFGHFVGMMREAWEGGCLRDYDGQVVGKGAEGEGRLGEIETRVWKEFEAKGCHYGVREWVLEVV
ncbi:hypothetical protein K525DRAFT_273600 [Schizophyllum commune Loenen D]|nr:hypothetical protein K525DRAFT_273600 [Schizophyllum commune Loenen D]